jgi:hypothetical protein
MLYKHTRSKAAHEKPVLLEALKKEKQSVSFAKAEPQLQLEQGRINPSDPSHSKRFNPAPTDPSQSKTFNPAPKACRSRICAASHCVGVYVQGFRAHSNGRPLQTRKELLLFRGIAHLFPCASRPASRLSQPQSSC